VDISAVQLCAPILLGEVSKKNWMANHFLKISKLTMYTSLSKAQHNKSCYMDSI
jgi:hypothetical protein